MMLLLATNYFYKTTVYIEVLNFLLLTSCLPFTFSNEQSLIPTYKYTSTYIMLMPSSRSSNSKLLKIVIQYKIRSTPTLKTCYSAVLSPSPTGNTKKLQTKTFRTQSMIQNKMLTARVTSRIAQISLDQSIHLNKIRAWSLKVYRRIFTQQGQRKTSKNDLKLIRKNNCVQRCSSMQFKSSKLSLKLAALPPSSTICNYSK